MEILEPTCSFSLENMEQDMTVAAELAVLNEKVNNHIKFFWGVVGFGFVWLAAISGFLWTLNGRLGSIQTAQANIPAQTVDALLSRPSNSSADMAATLNAVSVVLQSAKNSPLKADANLLKQISTKIADAQPTYSQLPATWSATAALISYKSSQVHLKGVGISPNSKCGYTLGDEGVVFTDCELSLEEAANRATNNTLNGQPLPYVFKHCNIRYQGGRIPLGTYLFQNSTFNLTVPNIPPHEGIEAMQKLTLADLNEPVMFQLG